MAVGVAIATLVVGGIQALMQAKANRQANATSQEALEFQRQAAEEARRFAQAARVDAWGNEVSYNEVLNRWDVQLTPMQQQILDQQESEIYKTLAIDAPRAREHRRRQEERAISADATLNDQIAQYLYDRPQSEEEIYADTLEEALYAREQAGEQGKDILGAQALRTYNSSAIPRLAQSVDQMLADTAEESVFRARRSARDESLTREAAHEGRYLPAIDTFYRQANRLDPTGVGGSSAPASVAGLTSEMASQIANALAQGNAGIGNAYNNLAATQRGSVPDFSGIYAGLGQLDSALTPEAPQDPYEFMNVGGTLVRIDPLTGAVEPAYSPPVAPSGGGGSTRPNYEYRTVGGNIIQLDPVTGATSIVYKGPVEQPRQVGAGAPF